MNQPRAVTEGEGGLVCKGEKKGMEGREQLLLGVGMCMGEEGEGRENSRERAGLQPASHLVHRALKASWDALGQASGQAWP